MPALRDSADFHGFNPCDGARLAIRQSCRLEGNLILKEDGSPLVFSTANSGVEGIFDRAERNQKQITRES